MTIQKLLARAKKSRGEQYKAIERLDNALHAFGCATGLDWDKFRALCLHDDDDVDRWRNGVLELIGQALLERERANQAMHELAQAIEKALKGPTP
jgi:hypothetical protein